MATLDLDPVFVKALRLLHSKAKDSASQLRAMVEESIASRRSQKSSGLLESEHKSVTKSSKDDDTNLTKKREPEKRSSEKVKHDVSELSVPSEAKRPKQESSPTLSHGKEEKKEKDKEREKEKARKEKERREQKEKEKERLEKERQKELEREREKEKLKEEESDEETEEEEEEDDKEMAVDADDFAIGLGISCEVCRQFDVCSGNQLVECQECHALYHQECHKPPVTEQDVNDPRFVWYCNKCSRSMKKMVAQKPAKHKPEKPSTPSKEVVSAVRPSKPEATPATFAFRRLEVKPTTSNTKEMPTTPVSSKPLLGLASLAANLSKPAATKLETAKPSQPAWKSELTKSGAKEGAIEKTARGDSTKTVKESKTGEVIKPGSPAGSSSGSGSKGGGGSSGKQSPVSSASASSLANKRLQIMKKNAARQQEKRVHIK